MIAIRRARARDAPGIAAVHVATWRSAYAGLLPDEFLENLSAIRLAGQYDRSIRMGLGVHVAIDASDDAEPELVGFTSARRSRSDRLGEGDHRRQCRAN